ncbi:hypothetical protein SPHINGO391_390157 [Sphingomonas aurantiaca]|uniref:Uncharacterized protein n=1 Tax=Sphingomonas aurantiaca TaxID=185949 RepID=A0A5E7YUX4_9SPHN|nr:hypothetical protein SPHINGO391_390157 [Sphingomonas aurantiaca]
MREGLGEGITANVAFVGYFNPSPSPSRKREGN